MVRLKGVVTPLGCPVTVIGYVPGVASRPTVIFKSLLQSGIQETFENLCVTEPGGLVGNPEADKVTASAVPLI